VMTTIEISSPHDLILVEEAGESVFVVKLNRPNVMNALTRPMITQLARTFDELATRNDVRVVILTGQGKSFCAGVDLSAAMSIFQGKVISDEENPVKAIERFPHPVIGAINGYAITGGFELALGCDILIASESAAFIDTHAKFGIHPSWGLSQKLSRLIGANRAREVSLSACKIDATLAEKWGLVSRVVPEKELLDHCKRLAKSIVSNHPGMVMQYRAVINDGLKMNLQDALQMEEQRAWQYYKTMTPEQFAMMNRFIQNRSQQATTPHPRAKL